ncbi:MAG: glycosyltransferase family 4 protein [Paludibacter sp.]|nr:glycosyltransferase family 4 protein [Paludibacter sp.]MDD4198265.1 glycosyltransferase family 4 protein [Paludibacter sp.]MDD4428033.1 glycosyltransferase family 4 protein [Paludibacter sp.]
MRKVLIITYYWIPSGGSGVQRWVKFVKYLRDFGWEPVIYAPENADYPVIDASFEDDVPAGITVIRRPIWEPYALYRRFTGKKDKAIQAGFVSDSKERDWKDKLSVWLRGNLFIPDPRKFWVRPAVKYLKQYVEQHPVDAIITNGPPHSMHLIGLKLKRIFPKIPWIADFRDPWTNIDFYKELHLTKWADAKNHRLECKVIQGADAVTVVSAGMREEFESKYTTQIYVIPNGFDDQDMKIDAPALDDCFSISHIGTMNAARNPIVLWQALQQLCDEQKIMKSELKIQLIGKVDFAVIEAVDSYGLQDCLVKTEYLKHDQAIQKQQSSQVLLLLINQTPNAKSILTGKFFEYLASNRPVIGVGPKDGDAARILQETGAGIMIDYEDVDGMKKVLLDYYKQYQQKALTLKTTSVTQFSRKNLTKELSNLINQLTTHA